MRTNRGFTLLEVLVAIMLASLLLTSIYGVFSTTSAAKEQVDQQGAALHLGRVLISRLDRELLGLTLNEPDPLPVIAGGENSLNEPYLAFVTTSTGAPQPGMRKVRYRLGRDQQGQLTLWRSETGLNSRAPATEENLAHGIAQLTFNFFDGRNWQDHWDSRNNGRPQLVRIGIKLDNLNGKPPLTSIFTLPQKRRVL